jgi:uncharacterized protein YifN (PemK superfamily)
MIHYLYRIGRIFGEMKGNSVIVDVHSLINTQAIRVVDYKTEDVLKKINTLFFLHLISWAIYPSLQSTASTRMFLITAEKGTCPVRTRTLL